MRALDDLRAALPKGRVLTEPADVEKYRGDVARLVSPGVPLAVVLAGSTADVVATLRWAHENRVPVVPRGGGSGLAGGAAAIDGGIVLSLAGMAAIREIAPADQLMVVEAGVFTADVDRAAREHGLMYPPDPASMEICTIGGNIATNAGGLRCVKYGVTRESVLGLEVVLADGRVLNTGRRTIKGVAGYDLTALFVGSEGTLGVVTAATLRLQPAPAAEPVTVVATLPTLPAAGAAVAEVVRRGLRPGLLELLDRATIRAVEAWRPRGLDTSAAALMVAQADGGDAVAPGADLAAAFKAAGATRVEVSTDAAQAAELLDIRRNTHWAIESLGLVLTEDVGVPRTRLADMLAAIEEISARHGVAVPTVAHAGDGNLHPSVVVDSGSTLDAGWAVAREIYRAALDLGGTITGEHGVGLLKREWLPEELGAVSLDVHASVKAALDPRGILNPGKAF